MESKTVKLFLASFLGLYFELLFIRWLPDSVHVFSFFGNFVLLAAFLGMGLGLAGKVTEEETDDRLLARFLAFTAVLVTLFCVFVYFKIDVPPPNQDVFFNDDAYIQGTQGPHLNLYVTVALFLTLVALTFVPTGKLMSRYLEQHPPLLGYTINILGSLLGIVGFSLMSFLRTPPPVWLAVGLVLCLPFTTRKIPLVLGTVLAVAGLFGFSQLEQATHGYEKRWSPYYNIRIYARDDGNYNVYIGNSCLLTGIDLSPQTQYGLFRAFYDFPYRFMPDPESVLILGSGMGNDVITAVHHGVEHVDAVEIDPVVASLGRTLHPEKPYTRPGVTLYNDDARSFIKKAQAAGRTYDLIIFATLDSHGLFSQMSSVKMENYVYTLECFQEARSLLSERGILYLNVGFMGKFVPLKLYNTLAAAFNDKPEFYVFQNVFSLFVAGNVDRTIDATDPRWSFEKAHPDMLGVADTVAAGVMPTDDWPQMYLRARRVPNEYLHALGILLVLSAALLFLYTPGSRGFRFDLHFFFLGAGFMLLETRSITQLGLLFGTTWLVNSIVISGILIMIFLANVYLLKRGSPLPLLPIYALLGLLLVVLYLVPVESLQVDNTALKLVLSIVFLCLPLLFAALIFGSTFSQTGQPSHSLASNMFGAMVGGALEYTSMAFGLKSLYLTALGLYVLSFAAFRTPKQQLGEGQQHQDDSSSPGPAEAGP